MTPDPPARVALKRGLCRRCPRCGKGPLFRGFKIRERCSECGLVFQHDYGDIWLFIVITDRIPLLLGIALVYFGFRSATGIHALIFFAAIAVPIVASIRERQGLALALDYLSRSRAAGESR